MIELMPYQKEGAKFLAARKRAVLADEMGLGKTGQAIAAVEKIFGSKPIKILVICPASVRSGWVREIPRFHGGKVEGRAFYQASSFSVVANGFTVLSYDLAVANLILRQLEKVQWDVIILDEVHFLKNRKAKRTSALFGHNCQGDDSSLISRAGYVWGLTGTPMPNGPGELYAMTRAFGFWDRPYYAFESRYCNMVMTNSGHAVLRGVKNVPELKKLLASFMLRRKKNDIMENRLPVIYEDMPIDPTGHIHPEDLKEWRIAESGAEGIFLRKFLERMDGKEDAPDFEKGLSKLHIATFRRITGMAKMKALAAQLAKEFAGGLKKVVVFGIHRDVVELLRCELEHYSPLLIYGGTKVESRETRLYQFKNHGQHRALIMNISAGGVGIDGLQEACHEMIFIESSWVPSENAQCVARLDRLGQQHQVRVRFAYLEGSLDEKIQRVIRSKTQMISQIFD